MPTPPMGIVDTLDDGDSRETVHSRTLGPRQEEYITKWPSGFVREVVTSDAELAKNAARHKAKKVKKKHELGPERYERNPHEPIKC